MKYLLLLLSVCFVCSVGYSDPEAAPEPIQIEAHIVETPGAVHPRALVKTIDPEILTVCFDWLDGSDNAIDSGNSIATYTTADDTEPPTDAELIAAIEAVAPSS